MEISEKKLEIYIGQASNILFNSNSDLAKAMLETPMNPAAVTYLLDSIEKITKRLIKIQTHIKNKAMHPDKDKNDWVKEGLIIVPMTQGGW